MQQGGSHSEEVEAEDHHLAGLEAQHQELSAGFAVDNIVDTWRRKPDIRHKRRMGLDHHSIARTGRRNRLDYRRPARLEFLVVLELLWRLVLGIVGHHILRIRCQELRILDGHLVNIQQRRSPCFVEGGSL